MALETATYISQLTATNPVASDSVSVGDDHLRMLKTVLKTQFSGLTGTTAIAASEAELNILDGVTSTAAELNILDGVTSTAAELNILDGVTSTAAELNIMDGVTSTAAEINLIDGGTSRGTTAVASGDGLLVNDGGTMRMTNVDTVSTYFASHTVGGGNIVTTGALNSGSITSGFGTIDTGSSTITTTGLISGGSLDIDNVLINGTTIGHTDDTDLMTLADSALTIAGDVVISGTTPLLTIGDAGAEDASILFDGNAKDFHIGLDDTSDKLVIGVDAALGTNTILTLTDDIVTLGDGAAVDTYLNFDGNAADFRIGIDDGTDKLEIGGGVSHGSAAGISMDVNGDMTLGGGIACADEVIGRPELRDYAESYTASSGGDVTLDLANGNVFQHTASGANVEFTFSNPPGSGKGGSFTLKWIQDSSDRTITWPTSVDWAGGSAPAVTSGSAKVDVYTFFTVDGGTIWYGFQAGADLG